MLIEVTECLIAFYFAIVRNIIRADCNAIAQEESANAKANLEINFLKEMFSFQLCKSMMTVLSFF